MTPLVEKDLVLAPLASADRFLHAFFASHPAPHGAGSRIVLHAANVAHAAILTVEPAPRPGDTTPRYHIHWSAEGIGAFPEFNGELFVDADEDYNGFWLILNGSYVPPGGIAGFFFDAVLGEHIAHATARALLRELRVSIEANFRLQERAKAS